MGQYTDETRGGLSAKGHYGSGSRQGQTGTPKKIRKWGRPTKARDERKGKGNPKLPLKASGRRDSCRKLQNPPHLAKIPAKSGKERKKRKESRKRRRGGNRGHRSKRKTRGQREWTKTKNIPWGESNKERHLTGRDRWWYTIPRTGYDLGSCAVAVVVPAKGQTEHASHPTRSRKQAI